MSLRTHAVVVDPDRWSKSTEELARLLAGVTGVDVTPLTALLERGPMTVEADLSPTDAKALKQRLQQMGVPAEVQVEAEEEQRPPALPGGLPTVEIPRAPAPPREREVWTEETTRPPLSGEDSPPPSEEPGEGVQIPGALEAMEGPRSTDEIPRRRSKTRPGVQHGTLPGVAPSDRTPTEGWGVLFPDLAGDQSEDAQKQKAGEKRIPTLDELESDAEAVPPSLTGDVAPERRTDELERDTPRTRSGTIPGGLGGDADPRAPVTRPPMQSGLDLDNQTLPTPTPSKKKDSPPTAQASPPSAEKSAAGSEQTSRPRSSGRPSAGAGQADGGGTTPPTTGDSSRESFDGSQLAGLVPTDEDRPPYAPTGFDPRPEHPPQVAAMMSVLAPGAGQVFNGEEDKALSYGLKFWLIKPWVDAVVDAYRRGEKIRTYWAPRPESGAFVGALKYMAAFWLCVALAGTLLYWGGAKLLEAARREPAPEIGPQQILAAVDDAGTKVLAARVAGLDALQEASFDAEPRPQYTMPDKERAERLFALGYRECAARNYSICEAMMKRVNELKNAHRAAIKLQAWASVSQRGGENEPMPDVGQVPTLSELELKHLRQEMALQGEDVPPPPEPGEEPDFIEETAADAGSRDAAEAAAGPDAGPEAPSDGEPTETEPVNR